jgi:peroxiredoxin
MKKTLVLLSAVLIGLAAYAQNGFKVGETVPEITLTNPLTGDDVSTADYEEAKGFIVVFTCNHCPYAQKYEQRIIELAEEFNAQGYPVIAISPNDPAAYPDDAPKQMAARAKEMSYPFPYLFDETQAVAKEFGAAVTPETRVLARTEAGLVLRYRGAIDDHYQDPTNVKRAYTADAVNALIAGEAIETTSAKAVGCSVKWKKS